MPPSTTVLKPRHGGTAVNSRSTEIPTDILRRSAGRLRGVAVVYAATFFMANFVSALIGGEVDSVFADPSSWLPGTVSIVVAVVVAIVANPDRVSARALAVLGPIFCVAGSYGIAFAEFWQAFARGAVRTESFWGLSWVAVWVVFFSIVVPQRPWRSFLAALAGGLAVYVVISLASRAGGHTLDLSPAHTFVGLVFPYLICAGMAHAGAKTIYRLGRDVRDARELGSYRLVEQLGQGGMGEVWRAEHRFLARPAAIKMMRPEILARSASETHSSLLHRFEREAQATAALQSPHTISVYDFGAADDGRFYYVMELLRGLDLQTLVERQGPVPSNRAVHFLRQVCHSLGEAHGKGFIHRDVKPANIYACRYGRELDFVKVLDFGLVKSPNLGRADRALVTGDAGVGGTPAFMAPEQIMGEAPIDHRADIYAIGCVAYWLLTGRVVFEGATAMKVMLSHAHDTPRPPSEATEMSIPASLEALVMECLAKNPEDRPPTTDALESRMVIGSDDDPWAPADAAAWWELHVPIDETAVTPVSST